ncbi:hypothetical protein MMAD_28220 [Mycolicibacterium madagascariense]|uniref:FAD-dependent oxidoreductase 2 FAD-binding domain-containing protein n=1 Tax=Mycolicibacterium madagascariense TaxID=212765 RepID=A0A7I7XH44_9MYCO|nr:FAD-binding protein [Mycolicibacterium madagascariense]MCV7014380.1 FAD-binding protein [Mycolicibacterium madagascariense]BBZ28527.1 hypothetical protein MMAD_28220 [Mycolicibacterium madagascariense]
MGFHATVDMLCVGVDPSVLAVAVSGAEADMDVLVVDCREGDFEATAVRSTPPTSWADDMSRAWNADGLSRETVAYLASLTEGVGSQRSSPASAVTLRQLDEGAHRFSTSKRASGRVAPFYGHQLIEWNRACLGSHYGVLYSRTSVPGAREIVQRSGERLEVTMVGAAPSPPTSAPLSAWLVDRAGDLGVRVMSSGPLRRLMFEDGVVIGAVFGSTSSRLAIRANHGVAMSTTAHGGDDRALTAAWYSTGAQLGVVSAAASRFGRLELVMDHAQPASPTLRSQRRTGRTSSVRGNTPR